MKLINYDYGFSNTFNCSIHGKIIVSREEWDSITHYLKNPFVKYEHKFLLKEDLLRAIKTIYKGQLAWKFNIRVSATEKVVKFFNIEGYKRGNYVFLVTK